MNKHTIRLKRDEFMKIAITKELYSQTQIAKAIGVSNSQVWRAFLSPDDERHNAPGTQLIAGALATFEVPFERIFFLDLELRGRDESVE